MNLINKNTFLLTTLATFVRTWLISLSGMVLGADAAAQAQSSGQIDFTTNMVVAVTVIIASQIWSFIEKFYQAKKLAKAIIAPAKSA